MYIVYLINRLHQLSGGVRVILDQANRLAKRDHKVEIWTMEPVSKPFFSCQVPAYYIHDTFGRTPDIVIICDTVYILSALKDIPAKKFFFLAQHDYVLIEEEENRRDFALNIKNFYSHFPKNCQIISVSSWLQDILYQKHRLSSHLIPNGVDLNLFRPTKPIIKYGAPVILSQYGLASWKGPMDNFTALAIILNSRQDAKIMMFGSFFPQCPENQEGQFLTPIIPSLIFTTHHRKRSPVFIARPPFFCLLRGARDLVCRDWKQWLVACQW